METESRYRKCEALINSLIEMLALPNFSSRIKILLVTSRTEILVPLFQNVVFKGNLE